MKNAFFSKLEIKKVALEEVALAYSEWLLGVGAFGRFRKGRLEAGVPERCTVAMLQSSGDHPGNNDCVIAARRSQDVAILRFVHRDRDEGSILWHNVVRLSRIADVHTQIEHCIVRTGPRDLALDPVATSPAIVSDLIQRLGSAGVTPKDLYKAKVSLTDANDVTDYFNHILLERTRTVPVLVVTASIRTEEATVDADSLAKNLRGMATVVELRTRVAAEAWTAAFEAANFDRQFSCFDGGVRLYAPGLVPDNALYRHTLWIRTTLLTFGEGVSSRTAILAGMVADRIATATMPNDLFSAVLAFDRNERMGTADRLLAAPSSVEGLDLPAAIAKIAALESSLRDTADENRLYEESNSALAAEMAEQRQQLSEREYEVQDARLKAETLEYALGARQQREADAIPLEIREALASQLTGTPLPEASLRLVAVAFPDRLIVLDSAYRGAKRSARYARPKEVLTQLVTLATTYFEAIKGKGANEARRCFGKNELATAESDTMSPEGKNRRCFTYKGELIYMEDHLKLGHKDSVYETMRTHFHWDADDEKIVIGHCGPHLDFD